MGFERFMVASLKNSDELTHLMRGVERLNIDLANRAAASGANGILIADDIAHKQGTSISPKTLRDLFFPSLQRQLDGMAHLRLPIFFHSDGNLNAVMDDLVGIGFQGLHCLESGAGMDLASLKATYGKRICLWGNLDPQNLFLEEESEELKKKVKQVIDVAAPGGGFIFGSSSGLVEGMRPKNIETVYRLVSGGEPSSRS
jgi:uroporphyrinogen decarboxylase